MSATKLAAALSAAGIEILKYDAKKQRPISTRSHGTVDIVKFAAKLRDLLGVNALKHPEVFTACSDPNSLSKMVEEYADENEISVEKKTYEVPPEYRRLTLNIDVTHQGQNTKFFMTDERELISPIAGAVWVKVMHIEEPTAVEMARKVQPEYMPRHRAGIHKLPGMSDIPIDTFNTYVPPRWKDFKDPLPDKLPVLFEKLVNHLFPLEEEREYFYNWLHASLFDRAFVFLVLCGAPGTGKNRLKLVLRALHGHWNSVDGKRSSFSERFNSQFGECTLAWFDELHYDMDMENTMKEVQNDSISIERKGVDATRSTKLHASFAIANNKPRDNYIAFDARKFAPLLLTEKRLETSMTKKEIDELTRKVEDWTKEEFDIKFLAQIARWVKKHGNTGKWTNLEYKGPMFYKLAHTSMSRWQKRAIQSILEMNDKNSGRIKFDPEKGYLWSSVAEVMNRKAGDKSLQFPDSSTVRHLFDVFVDAKGRKSFKTIGVPGNMMNDFYVKLIRKDVEIMSENEEIKKGGSGGKQVQEEDDDEDADIDDL